MDSDPNHYSKPDFMIRYELRQNVIDKTYVMVIAQHKIDDRNDRKVLSMTYHKTLEDAKKYAEDYQDIMNQKSNYTFKSGGWKQP